MERKVWSTCLHGEKWERLAILTRRNRSRPDHPWRVSNSETAHVPYQLCTRLTHCVVIMLIYPVGGLIQIIEKKNRNIWFKVFLVFRWLLNWYLNSYSSTTRWRLQGFQYFWNFRYQWRLPPTQNGRRGLSSLCLSHDGTFRLRL